MEPEFTKPIIPVGFCRSCGRESVFYGALDSAREVLVRRCASCDALGPDDVDLRGARELEGTPFVAGGPVSDSGGCGGGCSSGDCATCDSAATCGH